MNHLSANHILSCYHCVITALPCCHDWGQFSLPQFLVCHSLRFQTLARSRQKYSLSAKYSHLQSMGWGWETKFSKQATESEAKQDLSTCILGSQTFVFYIIITKQKQELLLIYDIYFILEDIALSLHGIIFKLAPQLCP